MYHINQFVQNGFFHLYQLDKSIFNLSAVGWYLSFLKTIDRAVWKRSVETLIRCHTPQCLIWVCTACPTRMFQVNIIIFFIAKVTVSFFSVWCENALVACRELFHAFLLSADVFILLYFFFCFFFQKTFFFKKKSK